MVYSTGMVRNIAPTKKLLKRAEKNTITKIKALDKRINKFVQKYGLEREDIMYKYPDLFTNWYDDVELFHPDYQIMIPDTAHEIPVSKVGSGDIVVGTYFWQKYPLVYQTQISTESRISLKRDELGTIMLAKGLQELKDGVLEDGTTVTHVFRKANELNHTSTPSH